jgi:hypothetical protein
MKISTNAKLKHDNEVLKTALKRIQDSEHGSGGQYLPKRFDKLAVAIKASKKLLKNES